MRLITIKARDQTIFQDQITFSATFCQLQDSNEQILRDFS